MLRRLWPILLCIAACGWAAVSFDWRMVAGTFTRFDVQHFLVVCVPVGFAVFVVRSLRWAAVTGTPFTPAALWRTHIQTAVAIATAAATPLQAGEAVKLKFAHDSTGADYASLSGAFAMERLADISVLLGLGALGFGLQRASGAWLLAAALLLSVAVLAMPAGLRWLSRWKLPTNLQLKLQPLADYRQTPARLFVLGVCTVLKWLGVTLLWQATFAAAGISIPLNECAITVVLVTLSVTISLVPGGIGVAEVSTRAVLVWLGVEPGLAEGGAIMLRLLLPLILAIGLLHGLVWIFRKRVEQHG